MFCVFLRRALVLNWVLSRLIHRPVLTTQAHWRAICSSSMCLISTRSKVCTCTIVRIWNGPTAGLVQFSWCPSQLSAHICPISTNFNEPELILPSLQVFWKLRQVFPMKLHPSAVFAAEWSAVEFTARQGEKSTMCWPWDNIWTIWQKGTLKVNVCSTWLCSCSFKHCNPATCSMGWNQLGVFLAKCFSPFDRWTFWCVSLRTLFCVFASCHGFHCRPCLLLLASWCLSFKMELYGQWRPVIQFSKCCVGSERSEGTPFYLVQSFYFKGGGRIVECQSCRPFIAEKVTCEWFDHLLLSEKNNCENLRRKTSYLSLLKTVRHALKPRR